MIAPYCTNGLFFSLLDFEDVADETSARELESSDVVQRIGRFFDGMSGTGEAEVPLFGGRTFFHERPELRFAMLFLYRQNFCPLRQIKRKIILHWNGVLIHALHCNASFSLVNVQFDAKISVHSSITKYVPSVKPTTKNFKRAL